MPHVILSNRALRDLDRLCQFLEEKSASVAEAGIRTIRRELPLLSVQPGIGRVLEYSPGYREWKVRFGRGAFRVVYALDGETVTIVSIQHSREAERIF